MAAINPPMPIFNGIVKKDKELAERIIQYEDSPSPLIIDLTENQNDPEKMFHFVNRANQHVITTQGQSRALNNKAAQDKRLNKNLPTSVRDKLK